MMLIRQVIMVATVAVGSFHLVPAQAAPSHTPSLSAFLDGSWTQQGKPKPKPKPDDENPPRPRPKPGPQGPGEED